MKRNRRTLIEMQQDAQEYALEAFRTTPFHLDEVIPPISSDERFKRQADAILIALGQAWAAGYAARSEEKAR